MTEEKKKEIIKFTEENYGKFAKLRYRNGLSSEFVKLHPMHIKSIEIGWITHIELHSDQDSNQIKQHIFKTKMELAKTSGRKYKV